MEFAATVKCLLCHGRQPFEKKCFNEMEMHLKSQHRVIFFVKELIKFTEDAKNKEERLANQTIDVDMEVKQEHDSFESDHCAQNEPIGNEDSESIIVEDDDIAMNESDYDTDRLIQEEYFENELLDSGGVSVTDYDDVPAVVSVDNSKNYAASNEIDKKVSFQIESKSNENLTEPPMNQSIVGSMPNEFCNNESPEPSLNSCESSELSLNSCESPELSLNSRESPELTLNSCESPELSLNYCESPELTLNSCESPELSLNSCKSPELSLNSCESPESVEALIDNLMSTDAFVNNMNWIAQTENAQMDGFEDSFDNGDSVLYFNKENSFEISAVIKESLEMLKETDVNINEVNTSIPKNDDIPTSSSSKAYPTDAGSTLDKLEALSYGSTRVMEVIPKSETVDITPAPSTDQDTFIDGSTKVMEIIVKQSETIDKTILTTSDSKPSLELLRRNMCKSPKKSNGWYDLVPRQTAKNPPKMQSDSVFKATDESKKVISKNHKRRIDLDTSQREPKKMRISPVDSVTFHKNNKKEILNDGNEFKCVQCNMMYASKQNLEKHKCKICKVDLQNQPFIKTRANNNNITSYKNKDSDRKQGGKSFSDESVLKQGKRNKGKSFNCDSCDKSFSSDNGRKVHSSKMHS